MATQELLIRHTTPRSRVVRRGGDDLRRPPGRPRRVTAPGVATAAAGCGRKSLSSGIQLALVGVLTFVVCLGLAGLNALSSSSQPVPSGVATVQVLPGETLSDVARRVAPDSPVADVVDRIVALNKLTGPTLHAGEPLQVPA